MSNEAAEVKKNADRKSAPEWNFSLCVNIDRNLFKYQVQWERLTRHGDGSVNIYIRAHSVIDFCCGALLAMRANDN